MFGIRRKSKKEKSFESSGMAGQDALDRTATNIAMKLIRGDCNALYKREMTQLFLESPGFIDDVAPEYRKALQKVLREAANSDR